MTDKNQENIVEETTVEQEVNPEEKAPGFGAFMKKYGFYIGIAAIMLVAIIVMFSDRNTNYSGDVDFEKPVYYITGNNLYIKNRGQDEILISSNLFQNPNALSNDEKLSVALISSDGQYLYFWENVAIDANGVALGDFCVFYKSRKYLIEEDTGIYFAASDDNSKIAYIKPNYGVQGGTGYDKVRYDLYTYSVKEGKKGIEAGVDYFWFNISGDGETVIYTKNYDATTDTSSLFISKDGKSTFIDSHMFFYGDYVPKGTFRQNWPKVNMDGTKIVYATRLEYGQLAKLHIWENGTTTMLGEDVLQIYTDENLDKGIMVHNYDQETFMGDLSMVDLNTHKAEYVTSDVWGLAAMNVAMTVDDGFIDNKLYFKNYDDVINVADLCTMTEEGEEVLIYATDVSNIQYSEDYSYIYGLEYYVPEEGGEITKIILTDDGIEKHDFDSFVEEFTISGSGRYLMYKGDENLFLVGDKNKKIYVDQVDIETYGIFDTEEQLYFFREMSMGIGNAYARSLAEKDDVQLIAENTHYCWDFGDGRLAFMTDFDFNSSTGSMYITDAEGGYELIGENIELPLFYNYIY